MRRLIPVVVVAGYLGAGKSTLLNHLLRSGHGARIGVVVNDFGAVNIDALLLTGAAEGHGGAVTTVAIEGGCVCCAAGDDELDEVLSALAGRDLDAIVIEASGLAEPGALVRRILLSCDSRVSLGAVVYLVDAEAFPRTLERHPSLTGHLRLADLVVLNKIDRCPDPRAARALVRAHAPTAPIVATVGGELDPALLIDAEVLARRRAERAAGPRQLTLDELLREQDCAHEADPLRPAHELAAVEGHGHLHEGYQAVDVRLERRVDPRRLAALLESPPVGVLRIKGFVETGDGTRFEVHTVGRQVRTERLRGARAAAAGSGSTLVFIGVGIDASQVQAAAAGTVGPETGPGGPEAGHGLLALLRYAPQER